MPLKILIVDDEKLERILIRNGYQWDANGFEVIGEAGSGTEALEFARHRRPDIILTDINMPGMDGLELTRQLAELHPRCRIIIITGYREFEYARRAVKLGVEDFLLKPINVKDLAESISHIKEAIEKEMQQKQEIEDLKQNILMDRDVVMESFFQRLVEKRISEEEAMQRLRMYNCVKLSDQCICIHIKFVNSEEDRNNFQYVEKVLELLYQMNHPDMIYFVHYMNNILVFLTDGKIEEAKTLGKDLHQTINLQFSAKTTIGMSDSNIGFDGISRSFYQSEQACSASVLLGRNRFISYEAYKDIMSIDKNEENIDWETFLFAVSHCLYEQVDGFLANYIQILKQTGITEVEYLRLNTMDLLMKAGFTLNKYGLNLTKLISEDELFYSIRNLSALDEAAILIHDVVNRILDFHYNLRSKKESKVVKEALRYIKRHLYDSELSLKHIAANIYANESYLSRMFKKEMAVSIIAYIMKLRIEEAICLLGTTDLMVYEIAEKIGFRESHYFSICFKKYTGMTIKEFKSGKSLSKKSEK